MRTSVVLLIVMALSGCGREWYEHENRAAEEYARLIRERIAVEKKVAEKCEAMGGLVTYGEPRSERVTLWQPAKSYNINWIPFKACQFPQGNVLIAPKDVER